jgi:hypothetical protein
MEFVPLKKQRKKGFREFTSKAFFFEIGAR